MSMSSLYLNKFAVIFCPVIDAQNNWETVVMNPQTEEILKIDKRGYDLLKKIDEAPGITKKELGTIKNLSFIDLMIRENIVLEKFF